MFRRTSIFLASWSPALNRSRYAFSSPADNGLGKVFKESRLPIPYFYFMLPLAASAFTKIFQLVLFYTALKELLSENAKLPKKIRRNLTEGLTFFGSYDNLFLVMKTGLGLFSYSD